MDSVNTLAFGVCVGWIMTYVKVRSEYELGQAENFMIFNVTMASIVHMKFLKTNAIVSKVLTEVLIWSDPHYC